MRRKSGNIQRAIPTPVCLPKPMIDALDAQVAREVLLSRSALIRRIVAEYFQQQGVDIRDFVKEAA